MIVWTSALIFSLVLGLAQADTVVDGGSSLPTVFPFVSVGEHVSLDATVEVSNGNTLRVIFSLPSEAGVVLVCKTVLGGLTRFV
jgi:hypothetical protein